MSPALLIRAAQGLFGRDWHAPLAAALGVSPGTLRRWYFGARPIPPAVRGALAKMVRAQAEHRKPGRGEDRPRPQCRDDACIT